MPKTKISDYSQTAASNTDINSINLAEGMLPSDVNNAIRELMKQLKDFQVGSQGDPQTVGGDFVVSGTSNLIGTATIDGLIFPTSDGTNGQFMKTNGSGTLSFATGASLATPLAVTGNDTAGAELRLPEDTDNGTNYVALKAPDSLAADYTCTLPDETCTLGFRNIPQNSQSDAYTLVLADSGKHILHPSADTTARTFTIPANSSVAFPIGTAITFINQNGAGVVTIAITTDTMRLSSAGTTGSRTLAANGSATCIKITSTEWIISGSGLT